MFIPDPDTDFSPSRISNTASKLRTRKKVQYRGGSETLQEKEQIVVTFAALIDVLSTVGAVEARGTVAGGGARHRVGVAARTRVARVARARVLQVAQQTGFPYVTKVMVKGTQA